MYSPPPPPTIQEHHPLLDVGGVFAPDQTPGVLELGVFGHGALLLLCFILLLELLEAQYTNKGIYFGS